MAQSSDHLHESPEVLGPNIIDRHRAIVSIMEEFEAIDWYAQRAAAAQDAELAAIITHNENEEKEHAVMTLEWLRRHDDVLDTALRTYLFTEEPVIEIEHEVESEGASATPVGSLGIGNLRDKEML